MKYIAPPKDLFVRNRAAFTARMKPDTLAVFHSNDLYITNADGQYAFTQNSSLFYLAGLDQEEVILVLFPNAPKPEWKEILFIRETNEHIQVWEGWKYSKEEARAASGVETVFWFHEFDTQLRWLMSQCDGVYVDINEHERNGLMHETSGHRMANKLRREYPAHQLYRAAPIVEDLRSIKQPEEIALLQTAINITADAFQRVLKFLKPGVMEYEVEAEVLHEFIRQRATGPAYGSIIASGGSACTLHYVENNRECKDGDLILMDFGAEYANYSADLTRTIPVNGKFTPRQKDVYNAVLRVQKASTNLLRPGLSLDEYHKKVGDIMTEELKGLGLLTQEDIDKAPKDKPAYKKYFPHGNSHFLGLDTHDVGNRYKPFRAGMVFTVEPGIYIQEENIGIRIENNILITDGDPIDLMAHIPREVDEIEALMA